MMTVVLILCAIHGVLELDELIEPYNVTLDDMSVRSKKILSIDNINEIYNLLIKYCLVDDRIKQEHIDGIKLKYRRRQGFSAPANVAFGLAIPYLIGIAICVGLAVFYQRKSNKMVE